MSDTLFPELTPRASDVLYIIGNGFDIAHGIESRYSDFKRWVKSSGNRQLIDMMDIFFSKCHDFWADIETALGEYSEEEIFDYCKPAEEIDYDHTMRSVAAIEDGPDWIFKPILDDFLESFIDWVNAIDLSPAHQIRQLAPQSKYLTFNYTETLEKVYGIPDNNVLHIHGSRKVADSAYIIGHNNYCSTLLYGDNDSELYFERNTKIKIVEWMNQLYKDTAVIISNNSSFFCSLAGITHIEVIGHSLNEVDMPYFDEVRKNVNENACWIFHCYSDEDRQRTETYIARTGIKNYRIIVPQC